MRETLCIRILRNGRSIGTEETTYERTIFLTPSLCLPSLSPFLSIFILSSRLFHSVVLSLFLSVSLPSFSLSLFLYIFVSLILVFISLRSLSISFCLSESLSLPIHISLHSQIVGCGYDQRDGGNISSNKPPPLQYIYLSLSYQVGLLSFHFLIPSSLQFDSLFLSLSKTIYSPNP